MLHKVEVKASLKMVSQTKVIMLKPEKSPTLLEMASERSKIDTKTWHWTVDLSEACKKEGMNP
jgi:hypothetical protein